MVNRTICQGAIYSPFCSYHQAKITMKDFSLSRSLVRVMGYIVKGRVRVTYFCANLINDKWFYDISKIYSKGNFTFPLFEVRMG